MNEIRYVEIYEESRKQILKNNPWRGTLIYFIVGLLWIFFSDSLVSAISNDVKTYEFLQMTKGGFYIVMTSIGLYFLMRLEQKKLIDANKKLVSYQEELMMFSEELITSEDELRQNLNQLTKITDQLMRQEAMNHEIFNQTNAAMIIWKEDGQVVRINRRFTENFGFSDAYVGQNLFDNLLMNDEVQMIDIIKHVKVYGHLNEIEARFIASDEKCHHVIWNMSKFELEDEDLFILYGVDMSRVYEKESEIKRINAIDSLTLLWKKEVFESDVNTWAEEDNDFAFYLIGIDNFSQLNDLYGHKYGDEYLRSISAEIDNIPGIKAYRWNGDEILIVEHMNDFTNVDTTMRQIQSVFHRERLINNISYHTKISAGVLIEKSVLRDSDAIVQKLHIALAKAKDLGKDQYVIYESSLHEDIVYKTRMENEIEDMLSDNAFSLFMQPIYKIDGKVLAGFEVLLRCNSDLCKVGIGDVIVFAEKTGQIIEIDRWVICSAFKMIADHRDFFESNDLTVSINISAQTFHLNEFNAFLEAELAYQRLDASLIHLEVTEYSLLKNIEESRDLMLSLKAQGFYISLDDFGTEYSSLNYLSKLPFDTLKIDRSYIAGIATSNKDLMIVKNLIRMARDLSMYTVAEGVETKEQLQVLKDLGCDFAQGYYLARPQSKNTLLEALSIQVS